MVKYLVQRPVAVLISFTALILAGLFFVWKVPTSLLPDVDVPKIVITVNYTNTPANVLEHNIIQPIRQQLNNLGSLNAIESKTTNQSAVIYLSFEYGTRMDLAYIEVNEKIDRLSNTFPRDMERPQISRINTSDIPIVRIHIVPKNEILLNEVIDLTNNILRKRIEQIQGVSMVDVNGTQETVISVIPHNNLLIAHGITEDAVINAIQHANFDLGSLTVKDGQYRYFIKLKNELTGTSQIAALPVRLKDGTIIRLDQLAAVKMIARRPTGYHLLNGRKGLVMTVQKQQASRMNDVMLDIKREIEQLKKDYSQVDFLFSQDQSFLLDAGISNLYQDIIYGAILTMLLIFIFSGNWVAPTLMSISIPVSVIITLFLFYILDLSFNIISLSGLALGIGMLIDNSIVVIDSITRRLGSGIPVLESCVGGTNTVIVPVVSQVLTTVAVYLPLILLNGMSGALIYDQSIALTISLAVSLLAAFILSPLLYRLIRQRTKPMETKESTIYKWVARRYHKMIDHILDHRRLYFLITLAIMPVGLAMFFFIPIKGLPPIEKKESLYLIDWNEPIDAQENLYRVKLLSTHIQPNCELTEAEVGIKQFLLQQNENASIQNAELYSAYTEERQKLKVDTIVAHWVKFHYPKALLKIIDAPNAFTQLFSEHEPYLEARFRLIEGNTVNTAHSLHHLIQELDFNFSLGDGFLNEPSIDIILDFERIALYDIDPVSVDNRLQQLFGSYKVTEIKRFGYIRNVIMSGNSVAMVDNLNTPVTSRNGESYPLNSFISIQNTTQPKYLTGDRSGIYQSIVIEESNADIMHIQKVLAKLKQKYGVDITFTGRYFENQEQIKQLWFVFLIVTFCLYIILAMQYENLILPLLVMLTIPLGISGGMLILWLTGQSLNVMSAIGFVVVLGLIVDDPILKIETLRQLEREYPIKDKNSLRKMLHKAGDICLRPLILVSLTTSIAMLPVLFIGGIGNDLQRPMALVIIGGLTIGTFFTTWFIPLAYWYTRKFYRRNEH